LPTSLDAGASIAITDYLTCSGTGTQNPQYISFSPVIITRNATTFAYNVATPATTTAYSSGSVTVTAACGANNTLEASTTCGPVTIVVSAEPTLTCEWTPGNTVRYVNSSGTIQQGGDVPTPTVKCGTSALSSGIAYRNASDGATYTTNPWSGVTASDSARHSVWAYVASDCGTSAKEARCNETNGNQATLRVKRVPVIASCTGTASQSVTLPTKPTQPTVTLTDPSNVCSDNNSNSPNASWIPTWTVSKNGTNASNGTWANIFDVAGTYNSYSVSGTCGGYSTALTSTCTGSATVSVSGGITISSSPISYTAGTYTVAANGCAGWGTKLFCKNNTGVNCDITINGTRYQDAACNGHCELLSIPAVPFDLQVNSTTSLACGN
jgi:hypothetical protein